VVVLVACGASAIVLCKDSPRLVAAPDAALSLTTADRLAGDAKAAPEASAALCTRTHPKDGGRPVAGSPGQGSTLALTRWADGSTIAYVAHEDDRALVAVDVDKKIVRAVTPLDGAPSSVLVLEDGRVVTTIRDKARVQVFEPAASSTEPLRSLCRVTVAAEPVALAATPDGRTVLVTSGWGHQLAALDARTFAVRLRADLPREPRAVVASDDGQRAFVAHVVDATMSVVDLTSRSTNVRPIDLAVKRNQQPLKGCQGFALAKSVASVAKPQGETAAIQGSTRARSRAAPKPTTSAPGASAGASASNDTPHATTITPSSATPTVAGRIFAPMVVVDVGTQGSPGYGNVDRGPTESPFVGVVDASAERSLARHVMSDPTLRRAECVLPRAAAYSPEQSALLVTCLGSDTVVELDARGLRMSKLEHRRWSVPQGPTGIAVDQERSRAVVWSQFGAALSTIALGDEGKVASVAVPPRNEHTLSIKLARGRTLFHTVGDARLSKDGRACASCHPDGRDDALTWETPDGARQTIMLAGRLDGTAPFSWGGKNATVEKHLESTLSRLGGTGLHDSDVGDRDALVSYIESLAPPPSSSVGSPDRVRAARGANLFRDEKQGCASCHVAGGTDHLVHSVDFLTVGAVSTQNFDTPSLRFVRGTAPYFHDGRFATLDQLLESPDHAMGESLHLSHDDRVALTAYLETL